MISITENKKGYIYFTISLLLSAFLVWYLLSQIKLEDIYKTFINLYPTTLMLYFFLAICGVLARSYRYYILISSKSRRIKFKDLILVTLVRNLFVDFLPARIGSLSYVYLLNRKLGFPFEIAASTFLISFILDFIVVFPMLFFAIMMVGINVFPVTSFPFIMISMVLLIFLVLLLVYLNRLVKVFADLLTWCLKILGKEGNLRLTGLIEKLLLTAKDIENIRERKIYGNVLLSSLAVRLFKYSSLYFLLHSVLVHLNFKMTDLNFWKVFLGILGAEFSALLPVHGIAGIGTWESAWVLIFKLLGFFDPDVAIISGFSVHIITQMFEYSLGILSIILLYLPFKKLLSVKKRI